MMKFTYKLSIRERVTAKCQRHPRYNPEKEGRKGIKGHCTACFSLYNLHNARVTLDAAAHEFLRIAGPWSQPTKVRTRREVPHVAEQHPRP